VKKIIFITKTKKNQGVKDFLYMCISNTDIQIFNCYFGNWGCILETTGITNCLFELILGGIIDENHIIELINSFLKTNKNIVHLNFNVYNIYFDKKVFLFFGFQICRQNEWKN